MLVLARRLKESIVIDGGIEIELLEIRGGMIRLGITAPKEIKVLRKELLAPKDDGGRDTKDGWTDNRGRLLP